ncbi:tetratricopeptide repeat protein [Leptotrichia sp. HSP-342]|uniref:Tetratricopeptide repeat protein n=1 Tax=Leptotrichia mesophila TaxID=3239303 RepID=A0AB39V8K9_9FUSO
MKKYLILLLVIINLGLGVQSFSAMTKEEKIKLEKQIQEAYDKNDEKKALLLVAKYVKEFPNNADYLNKLGVLYDNKDDHIEAEKWYLKAIDNGSFIAISNLANLYIEKKEYEKSIKYYKEYQKVADNTENYFWIAAAYAELEDYKNAKEWYLKSVKFEKDGSPENRLGLIFDNEGNQKEAIKWYNASIQKGNLWAYDNLAVLYLNLGDYDAAEKLVRKGLGLVKSPDDKDIKKEFEETLEMIKKAR